MCTVMFREYNCNCTVVNVVVLLDMRQRFKRQSQKFSNKTKYQVIFHRLLSLGRFLAKPMRVNKIDMKSFSKIYRSESTLSCKYRQLRIKIDTHNIGGIITN